jgi:hypothetical protein
MLSEFLFFIDVDGSGSEEEDESNQAAGSETQILPCVCKHCRQVILLCSAGVVPIQ